MPGGVPQLLIGRVDQPHVVNGSFQVFSSYYRDPESTDLVAAFKRGVGPLKRM